MKYRYCFIALFLSFTSIYQLKGQTKINAYKLKSTLIFKFGENIMWPNEQDIDTFTIGVINNDNKILPYLLRLAKYKKIKGRPVVVKPFKNILFESVPQIIVLDPIFNPSIKRLRKFSFAFPILVVSTNVKTDEDIMVNFVENNDHVSFQINSKNLLVQELTASSSLLLLGGSVGDVLSTYKAIDNKLVLAQEKLITQQNLLNARLREIDSIHNFLKKQNSKVQELSNKILAKNDSLVLKKKLLESQNDQFIVLIDSIANIKYLLKDKNLSYRKQQIVLLDQQKAVESYNAILQRQKLNILDQTLELEEQKKLIKQKNLLLEAQRRSDNYYIYVSVIIIIIGIFLFLYFLKNNKYKLDNELKQDIIDSLERRLNNSSFEIVSLNKDVDNLSFKNEEYFRTLQQNIFYAKKTHQALLADIVEIEFYLDAFYYGEVKDSISSDFIFFYRLEGTDLFSERYIIGLGDSGLKGIAAAFISIIANQVLKESFSINSKLKLDEILNYMNYSFSKIIQRKFSTIRQNLALSFISIERKIGNKVQVKFVGAQQHLYYFETKDRNLQKIEGENFFVGSTKEDDISKFVLREITLNKGDMLYLCSDGILKQRNPNGKNFEDENFVELLKKVASLPIFRQREIIKSSFNSFVQMKDIDDDITILGLRL